MTIDLRPARCGFAALLLIAELGPAAAQAPAPSDAAKGMVGTWELSDADREKTCTVNFKLTPAGTSYALELERKCAEMFPAVRALAGWTFGRNDNLVLTDAAGKPMLE